MYKEYLKWLMGEEITPMDVLDPEYGSKRICKFIAAKKEWRFPIWISQQIWHDLKQDSRTYDLDSTYRKRVDDEMLQDEIDHIDSQLMGYAIG